MPPEEDRASAGNMHKNLVKLGRVVFELCELTETDRQTDRHVCSSQYFAPPWGRSNRIYFDIAVTKTFSQFNAPYDVFDSRVLNSVTFHFNKQNISRIAYFTNAGGSRGMGTVIGCVSKYVCVSVCSRSKRKMV